MNSFLKKIINAYQDQPVLWKHISYPKQKQKKIRTEEEELIFRSYQQKIDHFIKQKQPVLILGPSKLREDFPYVSSILEFFKNNPKMRVLFIFPTNVLSRSRLEAFKHQYPSLAHLAEAYDSKTSLKNRTFIRNECRFIFTNPDMVHCSTVGNHSHWRYFLSHLDFIILDEVHNYSSVFGGHVANVIRRLLRLSDLCGSTPNLIATSDVFKNPVEFFKSLTGSIPNIVEVDLFQPSHSIQLALGTFDSSASISTTHLTTSLLSTLILMGKRCVVLAPSQSIAEQIVTPTRDLLSFNNLDPQIIKTYFPNDSIEKKKMTKHLFNQQKIKSIITNTFSRTEIDLSQTDILILHGYPGQNYKFWQEVENFAQNKKESYVFLILRKDPLQQHLFKYPDLLFELNPIYCAQENFSILKDHLLLAALETPLQYQEIERFGKHALNIIEELENENKMIRQHFHFKSKIAIKAIDVNLRMASKQDISLIQNDEVIKKIDLLYALKEFFPGAIYLSDHKAFEVDSLDLEAKEIHTKEVISTYLTQPIRKYQLLLKKILDSKRKCHCCQIELNIQTVAYQKVHVDRHEPLSLHSLNLPSYMMTTEGLYLHCERTTEEALHGLEHVLWLISPLITGINRQELGFYHTISPYQEVIFFDLQPGGSGASRLLYENISLALHEAKEFLESCSCEEGCFQCLWHHNCSEKNRGLSRPLTLQLIQNLLKDSL